MKYVPFTDENTRAENSARDKSMNDLIKRAVPDMMAVYAAGLPRGLSVLLCVQKTCDLYQYQILIKNISFRRVSISARINPYLSVVFSFTASLRKLVDCGRRNMSARYSPGTLLT